MRPFRLLLATLFVLSIANPSLAGGPITSGSTVAGTLTNPTYLESWTFSGTSGQRVVITAVTTSGSVSTNINLRAPGGASVVNTTADRVDYQLAATGVFTIEITDVGLNDAGNYNTAFVNLTAGPYTSVPDPDGGAIASSEVKTGSMSGAGDVDCFTFSGTNGQRVLMNAVATSGTHNTYLWLYPPAGGSYFAAQTTDRMDVQLNATGTWTLVVHDLGNVATGNYSVSLLNVTGGPLENGTDTDGETILSNDIKTGTFQQGVDFDAFTFAGTAGQRLIFMGIPTGAGSHDVQLSIYPPGGGTAEAGTSANRFDHGLLATGTYTVVVEDYQNDHTGTYAISMMNVTAGPYTNGSDPDGGAIASSEVKTGSMSGAGDVDCFTFSGTNGQRILMNAVATSGTHNTYLWLYPPAGGSYFAAQTTDRMDVQLNATGTWTLVVHDLGNVATGNYSVSLLNVTGGPLENGTDTDGETILSNAIKTGTFQQGVDFDAFTFAGTAGQRLIFMGIPTGAGSHDVQLSIYPPGGGTAEAGTSANRFDHGLLATGTYTVVVEDYQNDHTGTYAISMMNVTAGPYTNGSDPDGGAIASSEVKTGSMSGAGDVDCFTFSGTNGQRVLMNAVATSGTHNTYLWLYPPAGGSYFAAQTTDRMDVQLNATGTWTLVVHDLGNVATGNYSVSLLNVTGGPLENGTDTDGETILSNDIKTGTFQQGVDFDAFTFAGTAGQRLIFMGIPTGAGSHDVQLSIYPPGGGTAEAGTSANRFDHGLLATGTYTVVVEDYQNDHTGTYAISMMNVTAGPYTNGSDPDGGAIASSEVKTGSMSGAGDVDCFTFSGTNGQRILMNAVATSGTHNTYLWLYPPAGGSYFAAQTTDRMDVQLNATGTWTLVVHDLGNVATGNYSVSLLNVTGGPLENGTDTDGETILSNDIKTGTFQQGVDFDAFTFTGAVNRRFVFVGKATGAGSHDPQLSVYPPGGGAALASTSADRFDVMTTSSGIYTLVVEDYQDDHSGTYLISMVNVTSGPFTNAGDPDGGLVVSNDIKNGTTSGLGDLDAFQFQAFNGNRVLITAQATAGAGYNTYVWLYPPGGGTYFAAATSDRLDVQLNASGTWTIVVEDLSNDTAGSYTMSLLNASHGPYTTGSETDGGDLVEGVNENGSAIAIGDYDGYTFYGLVGQTAQLTATKTSGAMDTFISLYPPGGGAAVAATSTDNISPVLVSSGYYTVVVEDAGQNETGNYTLSLNLNGGPTDIGDGPLPLELALLPASPSPFSQTTRLGFELPAESQVHLRVFDVRGARVRSLVDDRRGAGLHSATWDGRDDRGARVASGVYYLQLEAGGQVKLRKVVLVK